MSKKICLFGDSIGKGIILNDESGRYEPCDSSFAKIIGRSDEYEIINFSRFGCTLTKGVEIVRRHLGELSEYDYVALEYGGNDSDFKWDCVARSPLAEHDCLTPMAQFKESYISLIESVRAAGSKPVLFSLAPIDSPRYYEWISKSNDGAAILEFLVDTGRIGRWNEMYDIAVREIGRECSVPVIDIRSAFLRRRDFHKLICSDGIHPNAEGHELIAQTILDYIRSAKQAAPVERVAAAQQVHSVNKPQKNSHLSIFGLHRSEACLPNE